MPRTASPPPPNVPALHPERDALLAAIRENPVPDLPRLIYADWQEEHGQPEHAELIRLQCQIRQLRGWANTDRRRELRKRIKSLLKTPALRVMARGPWACYADLDRGFSPHETITFNAAPDADEADAWWVFGPWKPDVPDLLPLDKVLELEVDFWDETAPGLAAEVVRRPWFRRAGKIGFAKCRIGPGDLRGVARSPHLAGLRELSFWQSSVDAGELARAALAPAAGQLTALELAAWCRITSGPDRKPDPAAFADALSRIGRSPRAAQLTEVYIDSREMTDAAARALLDSPRFAGLSSLRLPPRRLSKRVRAELADRFGDRVQFHPF